MAHWYSLLGLRLTSNLPIPGLPSADVGFGAAAPDVVVSLGPDPSPCSGPVSNSFGRTAVDGDSSEPWPLHVASSVTDGSGAPLLEVRRRSDGGAFRFDYRDGTRFWVDGDGSEVRGTWASASTLEDTAVYLLGPVMGFVLRLRGRVPLHASAVALGGGRGAVAFAGTAGAGKSTLAAAFAQRGLGVLTDDIAVVREPSAEDPRDGGEGPWIEPDIPRLRLWPESADLLFGDREALPALTPNWDKRSFALGPGSFESKPRRLAAIYLLDPQAGDGVEPGPLSPREALMALVANTYATRLLDRGMRRAELELLARVVSSVPVRRLHRDGRRPEALCRAVLGELASAEASGEAVAADRQAERAGV